MKKELDDLLCARYPELFVDRNLPASESCMAWGFSCGDGWFDLIEALCEVLNRSVKNTKPPRPQVTAKQVKEKFGRLAFYVSGADKYQAGAVSMAEAMSICICEECGEAGNTTVSPGRYISTKCALHMNEGDLPFTQWARKQKEEEQ